MSNGSHFHRTAAAQPAPVHLCSFRDQVAVHLFDKLLPRFVDPQIGQGFEIFVHGVVSKIVAVSTMERNPFPHTQLSELLHGADWTGSQWLLDPNGF
jgi:hypothetical protein